MHLTNWTNHLWVWNLSLELRACGFDTGKTTNRTSSRAHATIGVPRLTSPQSSRCSTSSILGMTYGLMLGLKNPYNMWEGPRSCVYHKSGGLFSLTTFRLTVRAINSNSWSILKPETFLGWLRLFSFWWNPKNLDDRPRNVNSRPKGVNSRPKRMRPRPFYPSETVRDLC